MQKAIIGTRPGENPFKLKLEPPDRIYLPWTKDTTFITSITLKNPTGKIQMYKIKCTDNKVFRVQQPLGFLDVGASVELKIYQFAKTRPEENKHYIFFLHHAATAEDKASKRDLAKIWKGDAAADGVTRVQAHFCEAPKARTATSVRASKSKTKTEASVEERKSPQRKSSKSAFVPMPSEMPAKAKGGDDKTKTTTGVAATPKKRPVVRTKKSSSTNKKGGDKTRTAEEE